MTHAELMSRAIELAVQNVRSGRGGPFGAVVARDGKIVAEGTNLVTSTNDPTAHAEMVAIREACRIIGSFQLTGCEIYASCEPCPMCLGAIYWARPERVYIAASRSDAAAAGFDDAMIYSEISDPPEKRRIPAVRLEHPDTQAPFEAWHKYANRISY